MKHIFAAIALCLLPGTTLLAQRTVTISGKIINPADEQLAVVNATSTAIVPSAKQELLNLKDGKFDIVIPVSEQYNWIVLGLGRQRFDFFVKEGSKLMITASNRLDSISISGTGSDLPKFFAGMSKDMGGIMGYYVSTQQVAVKDAANYPAGIDSMKQVALQYLATKGKSLPDAFVKYWKAFIDYSVYDAMLHYPFVHEQIRQRSDNINVQDIDPALYAITRSVPEAFNDRYLDIPFYQSYVQSYFHRILMSNGFVNIPVTDPQAGEEARKKALQQTDSALQLLYTRAPRKTGEFAAGRLLATELKGWPIEELESRIAVYKKYYPGSANIKVLEDIVGEVRKFDPGSMAPDFSFTTIDGKPMKLSELKGKVVYMDFWASWCGPCKGEMPHAKLIKEHFQGKDVVFLYVSIDDKEEAWKRGIQSLDISGMHTRTPGWTGDIAKLYQIQSVPAYFLIDRKGRLVSRNTPRPSQGEELIKLIEAQL